MPVYKILTLPQLGEFCMRGTFWGTEKDRKSGFIHLSANREQYLQVAEKYYPRNIDSVLIKLNTISLDLSYVNDFPHQNGPILWSDVMMITRLSESNLIHSETDHA